MLRLSYAATAAAAWLLLTWAPACAAELLDLPYKPEAATEYERDRCKLDLHTPDGAQGFPTLIWFHGGALRAGDKRDEIATAVKDRMLAQGVAVASVNYRLHPRVEYPAYVEDAAAAVAYVHNVVEQHGGARDAVFVSGHSAGGYLTLMVGAAPRFLEAHGMKLGALAGIMPISSQTVTHSTVRAERGVREGRPLIDAAAPAYYVSPEVPPALCIVGSDDLPARAEENRYFVAAMKAVGHEDVEYLEVAGRDHGTVASRINEPDDDVAEAMLQFIRRHSP